jgi:hypothetical protein
VDASKLSTVVKQGARGHSLLSVFSQFDVIFANMVELELI